MKLHLPKTLLVAVLAACGTLHAADQWGTPQFGGPEYTWTGSGDGTSYTNGANWQGGAAPARTSSDGPVLIFDGAIATVSGNGAANSSDKGGIKAINNSIVTAPLGGWGGSIYVEEESELTTSLTQQLKNTESRGNANVYVGGKLTITNTSLNFQDGNTWQNWQIDTNGSIDLSTLTSVTKHTDGWHLQYLADKIISPGSALDASTILNRNYGTESVSKQIVTSGISLNSTFDSVTVINKMTGRAVSADAYQLTYGDSGNLTVSHTKENYTNASLETSGDITWAHGTGGWTITGADGTDTSFLNGDTVKFVGNGTASLQGEIIVADISASDGVDYTVNMADNSSLTIRAQQDNFGGIKIIGGDTAALYLNMTTNAEGAGDGRIILSEGSTVGNIYVDGIFAYNKQSVNSVESNLGGANLHLGDGGVLLLRNGLSGKVDANIGDIYFDGANGVLRTYGSVSDAEVADNIYATTANLSKTDGGAITLSGTVNAASIIAKGGTLTLSGTVKSTNSIMVGGGNINITGTVTTNQLRLSEQGQGNVTISDGGKLSITGTNNNHETNASILLSHWGQSSKLTVAGGELAAKDTFVWASWTGAGSLEVTGGEANIKGLGFKGQVWGGTYTNKGKLILGNDTSGTGRLNIGSEGIKNASGNDVSITLGNGTIGALADWKITYDPDSPTLTPTTIQLVGANGGTVFDTTDATDKTTARTITVEVPMSGSGKLVKDGVGTLEVKGSMTDFNGLVEVKKGQMDLSGTMELSLLNLTVKAGAELSVGASGAGTVVVGSAATTYNTESTTGSTPSGVVTLEGGATITGNLDLSNATTLQLDKMTGTDLVTVTGDLTLPGGTLTLNGDILAKMGELVGGATLDIFSVGGAFNYGGQPVTDDFTIETGPRLDKVFDNGSSDYYLGYTMADGAVGGTVYIGKVIPEPTTATLSLLALAALAARRRRK